MKPLGVKKPLRNFEPSNPGSDKKLEPSPPSLVSYKKKECRPTINQSKGNILSFLTVSLDFFPW